MEFVPKEKEQMLINAGWNKEYCSLIKRPATEYRPEEYVGMQSWKKYELYSSYELNISFQDDGRHFCCLYLSGASEGIEFRIRSLRMMLKKFDLV